MRLLLKMELRRLKNSTFQFRFKKLFFDIPEQPDPGNGNVLRVLKIKC